MTTEVRAGCSRGDVIKSTRMTGKSSRQPRSRGARSPHVVRARPLSTCRARKLARHGQEALLELGEDRVALSLRGRVGLCSSGADEAPGLVCQLRRKPCVHRSLDCLPARRRRLSSRCTHQRLELLGEAQQLLDLDGEPVALGERHVVFYLMSSASIPAGKLVVSLPHSASKAYLPIR